MALYGTQSPLPRTHKALVLRMIECEIECNGVKAVFEG
jgi:hypothetical protein